MILKFRGYVRLSGYDSKFPYIRQGQKGGFGVKPDLITYIDDGVDRKDIIYEIKSAEVDGKVYADFVGQRLTGKISFGRDKEREYLEVGSSDIINILHQYKEQEVQLWVSERPFTAAQVSRMGEFYMLKEDWEAAHSYYLEAVQLGSRDSRDYCHVVETVTMAGKLIEFGVDAAFELIDRGLSINPSDSWLYEVRATMHEGLGMIDKAAEDRAKAQELEKARMAQAIQELEDAMKNTRRVGE